jgi:hypothetical protein
MLRLSASESFSNPQSPIHNFQKGSAASSSAATIGLEVPSLGESRNCTREPMTSVIKCFSPGGFSQLRVCNEPSMKTNFPFRRYWLHNSAILPYATIRCHSVVLSPLFPRNVSVARLNVDTRVPPVVVRSSGSLPRRPISRTLLSVPMLVLSLCI